MDETQLLVCVLGRVQLQLDELLRDNRHVVQDLRQLVTSVLEDLNELNSIDNELCRESQDKIVESAVTAEITEPKLSTTDLQRFDELSSKVIH